MPFFDGRYNLSGKYGFEHSLIKVYRSTVVFINGEGENNIAKFS